MGGSVARRDNASFCALRARGLPRRARIPRGPPRRLCRPLDHGADNRRRSRGSAHAAPLLPPFAGAELRRQGTGRRRSRSPISARNMSAVLIKIIPMTAESRSYTITTANPVVSVLGAGPPTLQSWIELAKTYVNYGIDHILLGADHLLFVLGLIWIVRGGWRLAKTITAFTIGHSVSLAAAAFGLIGVAGTAAQRLHRAEHRFCRRRDGEATARRSGAHGALSLGPSRARFGLVHGIGFASALAGLGIERRLLPAALAFLQYRRRDRATRLRAAGAGFDLGASPPERGPSAMGRSLARLTQSVRWRCSGSSVVFSASSSSLERKAPRHVAPPPAGHPDPSRDPRLDSPRLRA